MVGAALDLVTGPECAASLAPLVLPPKPGDLQTQAEVEKSLAAQLNHAWAWRGKGQYDQDYTQGSVADLIRDWGQSDAMPPDLLPRALYQCGHKEGTQPFGNYNAWQGQGS